MSPAEPARRAPTVLLADDHPLFGVALRLSIQHIAPTAAVYSADSFKGLQALVQQHPEADLVLLDLMMPDVQGLAALQYLRTEAPALRVAIVSGVTEPNWLRAAEALGAVAFVSKSARMEDIQQVLQRLLAGESHWPAQAITPASEAGRSDMARRLDKLSRQELRILLHIRDGRLNKQIAHDLGIAESTVKSHITTLLLKLDLHSRTQAAVLAQQLLSAPWEGGPPEPGT